MNSFRSLGTSAGALALLAACQTALAEHEENIRQNELDEIALNAVAPELRAFTTVWPTVNFDLEILDDYRQIARATVPEIPEEVTIVSIPGIDDAPPVELLIVDLDHQAKDKPAYLHMHGGGYILRSARDFATRLPDVAEACECVVVSVDYRLSPETSFPGPMEDNLAALMWVRDNAEMLNIDPDKIAIGGESAGGGHAAQLAIAARDRNIPIAFQVLIYPMLDDRTGGVHPVPDHIGNFIWTAESNQFAWSSYLGQPAGEEEPPYGAVPARVEDLWGLPPTWIGVGSVDLFFSENLEFAKRLGEAGVPVEVLVTPGGFHGFDAFAPESEAAQTFRESWRSALKRRFAD